MGLLDIGRGNPYATINPVAAALEGLTNGAVQGWNMGEASRKQDADIANQKATRDAQDELVLMQLTEAKRKQDEAARQLKGQQEFAKMNAPVYKPYFEQNQTPNTLQDVLGIDTSNAPPQFNVPSQMTPYAQGLLSDSMKGIPATIQRPPNINPMYAASTYNYPEVTNPQFTQTKDAILQEMRDQGGVTTRPQITPQQVFDHIATYGSPDKLGDAYKDLGLATKPDQITGKDFLTALATGKIDPESLQAARKPDGTMDWSKVQIYDDSKNQKDPVNDFATFKSGFAFKNPSLTGGALDAAASKAWHDMKAAEQRQMMEIRIPPFQSGSLPAGVSFNKRTNEYFANGVKLTSDQVKAMGIDYKQESAEAAQRGGAKAAAVDVANKQYISDSAELLRLAKDVDKNLLVKALPIIGNSVDLKEAEIAVKRQFGGSKEAAYISKALATAEALGNAISPSGQGSDFKMKLAVKLIKYGYDPATLKDVLDAHGHSLQAKSNAYKDFGKDSATTSTEKSYKWNPKTNKWE